MVSHNRSVCYDVFHCTPTLGGKQRCHFLGLCVRLFVIALCFIFIFIFIFWWSYSEGGQLTVVNLDALARGHGGIALCYVVTVATLPCCICHCAHVLTKRHGVVTVATLPHYPSLMSPSSGDVTL